MTTAMIEVHVNFGSDEEARRVSRAAVEQRLAACANIHAGMRSFYWWDGAVQSEDEIPVVFKTAVHNVDALMDFIATSHSYETPSIIAHQPVRVHATYLEWVHQETRREVP
jgi:periplasmic divalent cation tolerance protein